MKKYGFKTNIHILNALGVGFIVVLFLLIHSIGRRTSDYVLIIFAAIAMFNFVNSIVTFYKLYEDKVVLQSLTKKITIYFNEVECITEQPAGKLVSISVGVFAKDKKISITPWAKNYDELLKIIVNKCKKNEGCKIYSSV